MTTLDESSSRLRSDQSGSGEATECHDRQPVFFNLKFDDLPRQGMHQILIHRVAQDHDAAPFHLAIDELLKAARGFNPEEELPKGQSGIPRPAITRGSSPKDSVQVPCPSLPFIGASGAAC